MSLVIITCMCLYEMEPESRDELSYFSPSLQPPNQPLPLLVMKGGEKYELGQKASWMVLKDSIILKHSLKEAPIFWTSEYQPAAPSVPIIVLSLNYQICLLHKVFFDLLGPC